MRWNGKGKPILNFDRFAYKSRDMRFLNRWFFVQEFEMIAFKT